MKLAVSVDLDEIHCYRGLHGLDDGREERPVYERAIVRLAAWAEQRRLPLTWFVIGRDLERHDASDIVRGLAGAGHEIGCHSYSHYYDLTQRPAAVMRSEIERGLAAIERVTGRRVAGFRAPGYVVTDALLALMLECGLSYDSSVFPCPAYYIAKAAAVAARRHRRRSDAIIDGPSVLRAPTRPYRIGRPYWHRGEGIWEIPIQVTAKVRLPFIGTSLTVAGPVGARLLARGVVGEPFVNLELHGIDALDANDGLQELAKHQPDLRIPWAKKLDAIDAAVSLLRAKGYACVRMDELAAAARRAG